jgi:hypothetical protein
MKVVPFLVSGVWTSFFSSRAVVAVGTLILYPLLRQREHSLARSKYRGSQGGGVVGDETKLAVTILSGAENRSRGNDKL